MKCNVDGSVILYILNDSKILSLSIFLSHEKLLLFIISSIVNLYTVFYNIKVEKYKFLK